MKIETLAVHAGYEPDPTTKAVAVPIYQTTAYAFDNTQHGADLFDLKVEGNIYSRIMNPTTAVLEQRVAAMEGGLAGLCLASGQAATTYSLLTIAEAGDNFVTTSTLYGGTYNLFAHTFPQIGINARFAAPDDIDGMAALIDDRTKAVYLESLGNPAGNVVDLEAVAEMAHAHGVPVIVDNTVPSPYLNNPFKWGCDIIVHSLTKYMGGHGTIIGGALVDSGTFDWVANKDRFRRLNEPDVSYHGVVYTEALGEAAYIGRARVVPLRNMGAAIAPMTSFMALQGIETLPLRMDRMCENALTVAEHLQQQEHKGGIESGTKFIDALQLITRLVNIGDAKSLACHPASTTHRQLSPEELEASGVSDDLVRLSIGIEHIDDILEDIDQALAAAK
jgi:O-acetylhomoserine (thiol)-lyase